MAQLKQYSRPSVLESVKMFYTNALNFEDRSRRSEVWFVIFFKMAINFFYLILVFTINAFDHDVADIMFKAIAVELLIDAVPVLALTVRRLHDREVNAMWIIGMFIPVLCVVSTPYVIGNCLLGDSKIDEFTGSDSVKYYYE